MNPDKAQQNGKKPVVEAAGAKQVLTDGTRVVELHHLPNFGHHDGMLLAYFPKEKVLLEADAYNPQAANATPPSPPSPYTVSLVDHIQRLKLDVQRIVPGSLSGRQPRRDPRRADEVGRSSADPLMRTGGGLPATSRSPAAAAPSP